MKKLFITLITAITFITFITPPSFAIPGQLIYDTNVPDVINMPAPTGSCDTVVAPYKNESERNSSLYKACQIQKSQAEKINLTLMKEVSQEKKNAQNIVLISIVVIAIILLSSLGIVFLLKRKKTSNYGQAKQDSG